jgi:hypothetical protein
MTAIWIIGACILLCGLAAWGLVAGSDRDDTEDEPIEHELPDDDRWGEHKAMEDRK